jgi:hypothetical protein
LVARFSHRKPAFLAPEAEDVSHARDHVNMGSSRIQATPEFATLRCPVRSNCQPIPPMATVNA